MLKPGHPETPSTNASQGQAVDTLASSCASLDQRLFDYMNSQTEVLAACRDMRSCLDRLTEQGLGRSEGSQVSQLKLVQLPRKALAQDAGVPTAGPSGKLATEGLSGSDSPLGEVQSNASSFPGPPADGEEVAGAKLPSENKTEGKEKPQVDAHDVHKHWGKRLVQCRSQNMTRIESDLIRTATSRAPARHWQEALGNIVKSSQYEAFAIILICTHSIYIGLQVELDAWELGMRDGQHTGDRTEEASTAFEVIDNIFLAAFFLEWLLRVLPEPHRFFRGKDLAWNWFDTFIVVFMVIEALLMWTLQTVAANSQVTLLRLFRIFRIFRVVRIIRVVKSLRELRCMISSIMHALKSLVWTSVVVGMQLYMFGIVLTQGAVDYIFDLRKLADPDTPPSHLEERLEHYFGSLERTALTLFQSIATGISWEKLVDVLEPLGPGYVAILLVFIAVSIFAVMNVVTGVFVSTAINVAQQDKDSLIQEEIRNKERYLKQMRQVFREVDTNQSGTLSMEEFEEALRDERVVAYLNAMDLDFTDVKTLFILLDRDTNGTIDIDEFFAGCLRFKGDAKSIDIAKLQYELEWVMYNIAALLHGPDAAVSDLPATCRHSAKIRDSSPRSVTSLPLGNIPPATKLSTRSSAGGDSNTGSSYSRQARGNSMGSDTGMLPDRVNSAASLKQDMPAVQEEALRLDWGSAAIAETADRKRPGPTPSFESPSLAPVTNLQQASEQDLSDLKWDSLKIFNSKRRTESL